MELLFQLDKGKQRVKSSWDVDENGLMNKEKHNVVKIPKWMSGWMEEKKCRCCWADQRHASMCSRWIARCWRRCLPSWGSRWRGPGVGGKRMGSSPAPPARLPYVFPHLLVPLPAPRHLPQSLHRPQAHCCCRSQTSLASRAPRASYSSCPTSHRWPAQSHKKNIPTYMHVVYTCILYIHAYRIIGYTNTVHCIYGAEYTL